MGQRRQVELLTWYEVVELDYLRRFPLFRSSWFSLFNPGMYMSDHI